MKILKVGLGLDGYIGSGKSTVVFFFLEWGGLAVGRSGAAGGVMDRGVGT